MSISIHIHGLMFDSPETFSQYWYRSLFALCIYTDWSAMCGWNPKDILLWRHLSSGYIGSHHYTRLGCSVMHTFIPTFYTNTTWFFICALDPQLIQVKFQIQIRVLGAMASILHRNGENPHFHQFKHTEISFTSVVSSVGWVLWFCYKLQFWVFWKFSS
jgi:hypothetical protein